MRPSATANMRVIPLINEELFNPSCECYSAFRQHIARHGGCGGWFMYHYAPRE
jgi:hypothetical protein